MKEEDDWSPHGRSRSARLAWKRRREEQGDLVPLPGRDDDWLNAVESVGRALDRMEKLRAQVARGQAFLDAQRNDMQRKLDQYPSIKELYLSFVGANAGRTGKEFKRWIAAHGAATPTGTPRKLKVVVDNSKPKSNRVRLTMAARVRLKSE